MPVAVKNRGEGCVESVVAVAIVLADWLPAAVGGSKVRRGVIPRVERITAIAIADVGAGKAAAFGIKIQIRHQLITAEIEAVPVVIGQAVGGRGGWRAAGVARITVARFVTGAGEVITHIVQIG